VAHRGEHQRPGVSENTFAAFDPAVAAGVAAIEFDIRYTQDDEPVVTHDADLKRVFGRGDVVAQTPWPTLKRIAPRLPHLGALLERYAPRTHLMIELKTRGSARAEQRLSEHLAGLRPVDDFHMLALDPCQFAAVGQLPAACCVPVAKLNLGALYTWALSQPCAGLAGPYALLRNRQIQNLKRERGFVGSGFVTQPTILKREIARGVDWIFSDTAVRLQAVLEALKR
jgi:glycerophosphoryl diester phosphodiesterase